MDLPAGVLTKAATENAETKIDGGEKVQSTVPSQNTAEDTIQTITESDPAMIETGTMDSERDSERKFGVAEAIFNIMRHIPVVNLLALFAMYLVGADDRSEASIIEESLVMLLLDIGLFIAFIRLNNLSYPQLIDLVNLFH